MPMQPLTCSGPGELLHVDFTSIEETVPLKEEPVICNVLVLQDHFSKYVVAYVVKDSDCSYGCRDSEKWIFRVVRSTRISSQ